MTARTTATAKTTAPQFAAAWKLAHCHHHWWAVTAAPAVWALAAAAARATAALDAARAEALAPSYESDAFEAARRASHVADAALAAADEAASYFDARPPTGPEELEACREIAAARDPSGWGGCDFILDPDGVVRHTTCSGRTAWSIAPDGAVTLSRLVDGEAGLAARVSPDGRVRWSGEAWALCDLQRIAECLAALGHRRAARAAYLLAEPEWLRCADEYRFKDEVVSACDAIRGARRVIDTPIGEGYRARYDAAREAYLAAGVA